MRFKETFFIKDVIEKSTDTMIIADVVLSKINYKKEEKVYVVKAFKEDVLTAKKLKGLEVVLELVMTATKNNYPSGLMITEIRALKAQEKKVEPEPNVPEYEPWMG